MLPEISSTFNPKATHVGRLAYEDDILSSLEAYCKEHQIQTAWVNLLGALSQCTLAYYDQVTHQYHARLFEGEYEILNGTGNITLKDGEPIGHIHLTLSGTDFNCVGGHLMKGDTKIFACEFVLYELDGNPPLMRCPNDNNTGLPLWQNPGN